MNLKNSGFVYYEEAKPWYVQQKMERSDVLYLANVVEFDIQKEYPVHADLVNQRLTPSLADKKQRL